MIIIPLSTPLVIAGRTIGAVELRPPGRKLFKVMQLERGPVRFSEAAVARFSARLSGHGEGTVGRLSDDDLAKVAQAVEELYAHGRRRFAARSALTEAGRASERASREANE